MAFESILSADRRRPARWKRATVAISLLLHVGALIVGIIYSFWRVEELPLPTVVVTLMAGMPPPPPPPPPPAGGGKKKTQKPKTKPTDVTPKPELTQPKDAPKEAPPKVEKEDEDNGVEGGVKGGVVGGEVGGVKGGVIGGVLGGTPPPPPKNDEQPKVLDARAGHGQLAIDPQAEAYKVRIPPALDRPGMHFLAVVRVSVNAQGLVTSVAVLKGADPAIDGQIPTVIRRWRYHPLMVGGRAVPFTYAFRYDVSAR